MLEWLIVKGLFLLVLIQNSINTTKYLLLTILPFHHLPSMFFTFHL